MTDPGFSISLRVESSTASLASNVFARQADQYPVAVSGPENAIGNSVQVISNNTVDGSGTLLSYLGLPGKSVAIRDNLLSETAGNLLVPESLLGTAANAWTIERNRGGRNGGAAPGKTELPLVAEADRGPIRYLSTDPADRNYLRLDPDWLKERVQPGDPVPGAFPPAPAPRVVTGSRACRNGTPPS